MNAGLVKAVLLAWPVVVAALFRVIGPRRAALVGILGGFLFLPAQQVKLDLAGFAFPVDKWNMSGLALALGVLTFDRRTLRSARPRWVDLPMAAYYLAPLIGLATDVSGSSSDILDVMIGRGLGWVVPYAIGRLYFGRDDGAREVAEALVISGLVYIPICLYEEAVGPSRYLAGLIYSIPYQAGMVDRLGGWRPEGFLGEGLTLAAWMALTAVTATWLWIGGRRVGRIPAWPLATALVLITLTCRGIYGYLLLAIGITSALATRYFRTRVVLGTLLALPVIYMTLRASGAWDGAALVRGAAMLGRLETVNWRIQAEDEVIARVLARNPAFGFGNYIWHGEIPHWPDGAWLHSLWMGGIVGLTLRLVALHAWPAALTLARPRSRPDERRASSPAWALACWCILQMIDCMHNTSFITPTALIAGALIGLAYRRGDDSSSDRGADRPVGTDRKPSPVSLIVTIVVLVAIEALGRSTASILAEVRPNPPGAEPLGVRRDGDPASAPPTANPGLR